MGIVPRDNWAVTDDEMKQLPVIEYAGQALTPTRGSSDCCSICLADFELGTSLRQLPCDHCFHVGCIDMWLQRNRACPLCVESLELQKKSYFSRANLRKAFRRMGNRAQRPTTPQGIPQPLEVAAVVEQPAEPDAVRQAAQRSALAVEPRLQPTANPQVESALRHRLGRS